MIGDSCHGSVPMPSSLVNHRATAAFCRTSAPATTTADPTAATTPSLKTATHGDAQRRLTASRPPFIVSLTLRCFPQRVQGAPLALRPVRLRRRVRGDRRPPLRDVRRPPLLFPGRLPVRAGEGDRRFVQRHGRKRALREHRGHLYEVRDPQPGKYRHTSAER